MIELKVDQKNVSAKHDITQISEKQLSALIKKYVKGCSKIYHQPGIYTAKGDALYDFTCDSTHRCPQCKKHWFSVSSQSQRRNQIKIAQQNEKKVQIKREEIRKKYFLGKPGCKCTKDNFCQLCLSSLQNVVTTLEKGCGKTWQQNFGGMAAGPAYVTCYNNYFLCQVCSQQLAYINSLKKEYPDIKIEHIPEEEKLFWSPGQSPYYSGYL